VSPTDRNWLDSPAWPRTTHGTTLALKVLLPEQNLNVL